MLMFLILFYIFYSFDFNVMPLCKSTPIKKILLVFLGCLQILEGVLLIESPNITITKTDVLKTLNIIYGLIADRKGFSLMFRV
jgi:hypothetical protein